MIVGLNGIIQGGVSVKDFSKVTQIDEDNSEKILNNFINTGIGNLKDDLDINLIFNRSHLGESVYSPLYRGYSGDFVFDIVVE